MWVAAELLGKEEEKALAHALGSARTCAEQLPVSERNLAGYAKRSSVLKIPPWRAGGLNVAFSTRKPAVHK